MYFILITVKTNNLVYLRETYIEKLTNLLANKLENILAILPVSIFFMDTGFLYFNFRFYSLNFFHKPKNLTPDQ